MAVSASIKTFKHIAHIARAALLVFFAFTAQLTHAQWTALNAPGQSSRPVANQPTVLAIAKSARILAVGHSSGKSVAFYHPDTAALIGTTALPKEPIDVAISDDGSKAFALYESSGIKIAVINTATRAITNTWSTTGTPVGMVLNGAELLIADSNADRLVGISSTAGTVTRTKALTKKPQLIGIGASSSLILVGVKNGELQLLDTSTLNVTRSVTVGDDIRSLAWWEGGTSGTGNARVLAVGKNQNALNLVDPATGTINRVALGGDPNTLSIEQHNNWAYVGEKSDQIISIIDLINRALSGYFTIPGKIGSLLFDQQGELLFVSLTNDDKLLKLDPAQASLITKIGVSKTLKDVAVNSTTNDAITISDKDNDFARIKLSDRSIQTIALPVKADKVVVDSGLNIAIVGATNNKLSFVNLAPTPLAPASLYPQTVDLDGSIKDMAVDSTRNITIAVVGDKQRIRVVNNVTRTEIAQIATADKYVAVAIHAGKGIAYLATDNKKLSLLDLTTRTVTQTITLGFDTEGIAVDPALNRAVLTTKAQDKAWILNLDTLQMVTSLIMGKNPGAVAIQTDTHIAVVASKDDDALSLIDLTTNTATLNFNQIGKPTGLAISNRYNEVLVVSSDKDDLAIVQLSNPAATISAIAPTQATAGASATTLTVTGTHFIDGAVIYFGATALATTWQTSGTLTAIIPAALLTTAGSTNIRVLNPAPAGGYSTSLVFTIVIPAPLLGTVNPVTVVADNTAKTFTLTGSNFYAPVSVVAGTQTIATTSSTLTSAQVTLPATLFTAPGTLTISIQAAGGTSNSKPITLTAAAPTLAAFTPATLKANSTAQTLSLTGSNFIAPVNVRFDGSLIAVTPTSTTQITLSIPGTLLTTVKTASLTIDAAGSTSNALTINILAPPAEPFLYSSAPATLLAINQAIPVTLSGQNFVSGAVVLLRVSPATTTTSLPANFINNQQLKITIPAANTAAAGTLILKIQNPDGSQSNEYSLPVTAPQLIVSAIAPARGAIGSTVTIFGTGFSANAAGNVVTFTGNAAATIQSATTTTLAVTVPAGAQTGAVQVAVGTRTATTSTFTVGQTPDQDFAFGANAAQVILYQGSSTSVDVQLNNAGSATYTNLAKLAVSGAAAGVTAAPSRPYLSNGQAASIVLKADATATVGTFTLTVTATGPTANGTDTKTATVNVEVRSKANVTGVKGRFVDAKGMGIGGVLVRNDTNQVQTDSAGNFLLVGLPAGTLTLRFDATPAHPLYPIWPYTVTVTQGQLLTIADWIINPPPADDKFTTINNATQDQQITDTRFPGVAITLPVGVTITGWDGVKKTRIAIERLDPDKLPVQAPPLPSRSSYQLYFGTPMGGIPSAPIPVTLPNDLELEPGEKAQLLFFDGSPMGGDGTWKTTGTGTVSADGLTITSDPGNGVPRFCGVCGLVSFCRPDPPPDPPPCPTCGKPISLASGQERMSVTDFTLAGRLPISMSRRFNPQDPFNNIGGTTASFGLGWISDYDIALLPFAGPQKRLSMPDRPRVNFVDDGSGNYINKDDSRFRGAKMVQAGSSLWEVRFAGGSVWRFKPYSGITGVLRGGPPYFLAEMQNGNGDILFLTRTTNGRLTAIGTPERQITFALNADGFVDTMVDPLGRQVKYVYNAQKRIESVTYPDGLAERYTYTDDTEFPIPPVCLPILNSPVSAAVSSKLGGALSAINTKAGGVVTSSRPAGQVFVPGPPTLPKRGGGVRLKTIQKPGEQPWVNQYGPSWRILKQTAPDGAEMKIAYSVIGACVVHQSNPTQICTQGCPSVDSLENVQAGWLILGGDVIQAQVTDARGNITTQRLDSKRTVTASEDAQGQPTQYTRDPVTRNITRMVDVLGRTTRYSYDSEGRQLASVDALGRLSEIAYDAKWKKPQVTTRYLDNGTPVFTTRSYDPLTGKPITVTNPLGNITAFTYTAKGQLETITNPLGHITRLEYNPAGDLLKATNPLSQTVQMVPDLAGRSIEVNDPLGFKNATRYDVLDRAVETTDPLLGKTLVAYNPQRNMESITDARGLIIERNAHDLRHRLIERTDALGMKTAYRYNAQGSLVGTTDRKGQSAALTYDEQDRIVRETYPDGAVQEYLYDAVGRVGQINESGGAVPTRQAYTYDAVDRVTRIDMTTGALNYTFGYNYDALDRTTRRTLTYQGQTEATDYGYDKAGNLTVLTYKNKTTRYEWDQARRLTKKTLPNGIVEEFLYDDASQLASTVYKKPDPQNVGQFIIIDTIGYSYDANGRRTSRTSSALIATSPETPYTATYDAANRMNSVTLKGAGLNNTDVTYTLGYDANGNLVTKQGGGETTTYTWDGRNRMIGIARSGGMQGTLAASYQYDAFNRRIERSVTNGASQQETTRYLYEGPQAVAEIRATGGNSGTTTYLLTGLAVDEVIARYTGVDARTYLTDALGNVLALAKDDQSIATTYGYSPYGETAASGETSANDSQYTARENDGTGLYYYRARYYDPVLKRFIAEDPIGLGGGINAYAYVGGDPVSFVDPSGYCQVAVWMGGYIMGWRPCDEPPKPKPPSDPNCPPEPQLGPVELPTKIPEDPIVYPEKTPPEAPIRRTSCFAQCMLAGGFIDFATFGGKEYAVHQAAHGWTASGAARAGLTSAGSRVVLVYGLLNLKKGLEDTYEICTRACTE